MNRVVLFLLPVALAMPFTDLLSHTRVELTSLIADAPLIAHVSPLDERKIRAQAGELIALLSTIRNEDEQQHFYQKFAAAHSKIFPQDDKLTIESLQIQFTPLLVELDDALMILTEGKETLFLRSELAELQSKLLVINDGRDLIEWLTRLTLLSAELRKSAVPADLELLTGDIEVLLINLSKYLDQLNAAGIDASPLHEDVASLQHALQTVQNDAELDALLHKLEILLTTINR